jgi:hypothetical protein
MQALFFTIKNLRGLESSRGRASVIAQAKKVTAWGHTILDYYCDGWCHIFIIVSLTTVSIVRRNVTPVTVFIKIYANFMLLIVMKF